MSNVSADMASAMRWRTSSRWAAVSGVFGTNWIWWGNKAVLVFFF